jgi:protein SCO1
MKVRCPIAFAVVLSAAVPHNLRMVSAPEKPESDQEKSFSEQRSVQADLLVHVPDIKVYDQNNKRLKFYSDLVKGKTVAINFIFTTSTTIDPPLTATLRRVQQALGERVERDIQLISVTVDPLNDTPEKMKDYADKFQARPGWSFVTGDKKDIDTLLKALGAFVESKDDHTPMILIGNDSAGYWTRAYGLSAPSVLASLILNAADRKPVPQRTIKSRRSSGRKKNEE